MINGCVIYESEFGDDRQGTSKTIKTDPFSLSIRADSSSSNEDMRKCNGMFVFFEIASSDSWVGSVTSIQVLSSIMVESSTLHYTNNYYKT